MPLYKLEVGNTRHTLNAVIEEGGGLLVDLDRYDSEKCRVYGAECGDDGVYTGGQFPQACVERIGVKTAPEVESIINE